MKLLPAITLCCILCLLSLRMKAQPGLGSSALNNYNQTLSFISINDSILPQQLSGGANVTWNFSAITPAGLSTTTTYIDPALTPFASDFAGSNYCASILSPQDSNYTYANLNSVHYDIYGSRSVNDGDTSRTDFTNIYTAYIFPFNYGDNFSDTYESWTVSAAISAHRVSNMDLTYSGYGTLILPSVTYPNIMLLKRNYFSDDTLVIAGQPSPRTRSGASFTFIDPVQSGNIFSIIYDTTTIANPPAVITSYNTCIRTFALDVAENSKSNILSVFPNPATDRLMINVENGSHYSGYTISDAEGRAITEEQMIIDYNFAVAIHALPTGIYSIRLFNEAESVSRKFVKF
jgi:hypothetical protein